MSCFDTKIDLLLKYSVFVQVILNPELEKVVLYMIIFIADIEVDKFYTSVPIHSTDFTSNFTLE